MKTFRLVVLLMIIAVSPAAAQMSASPSHDGVPAAYMKFDNLKWQKLVPAEGAGSPDVTFLHVDPKSGATQLMIRTPKNYHAPRHWHTANEAHTVISGTFIMQDDGGQRQVLGPGSFNYMPSKMVHQAWTPPNEGCLVFVTVDGPWDLNLMEGPNKKLPPAN